MIHKCNNSNTISHACTCCNYQVNNKKKKEIRVTVKDVKEVLSTATAGLLLIKTAYEVFKIFKK